MSCGVGCRRGSDPVLLWLWRRPVATAPIQPLAWELPYAVGAALEKTTNKSKKPNLENRNKLTDFKTNLTVTQVNLLGGEGGIVRFGIIHTHYCIK